MKMNRGILAEGLILKAISPLPYEKVQRLLSPVSTKVLGLLPLKSLNCTKTYIQRPNGSKMRTCVMKSKKHGGRTVGILWLHGGGYVLGAPEMAIMSFPRHLLKNTDCVIVAPDYTLSASKPFPAALNDAYTALQWLKENRTALGIDCERFVVGGESAGGGLTAALCTYVRDRGDDCIAFQLPLYPMLDDRVTSTSYNNNAPVWNTKANKAAWRIYLGEHVMNNGVSPYAAPARCENTEGLPPAISVIGTIEPFYAETLTYFRRLNEAGVATALREFEGAYHAFDMLAPYAKISKSANAFMLEQYEIFKKTYLV